MISCLWRRKGIHHLDNDRQFTTFSRFSDRISQRGILPNAIKPAQTATTVIINTQAEILGPYTVNNGSSLSLQSIITNENPAYRIGGVPYCITYFQDQIDTDHIIGATIGTGDYIINGPLPMAQFSPHAIGGSAGGNDGNNLVYLTELINNSGSTQTIYVITNTRVFVPTGGSAA